MNKLSTIVRHYSTWVAFMASSAAAYWLDMTPEQQAALLAAYPALKLGAPAVSFLAFMLAKALVQPPPKG